MVDRTDTKFNSFSRRGIAKPGIQAILAGSIFFVVAVCSGSVRGSDLAHLDSGGVSAPAVMSDDWESTLLDLLRIWARLLQFTPPYGTEPVSWLNDFNSSYAANGLPGTLSESDREQMFSTLDNLQTHLAANPAAVDPVLFDRTMQTIEQARRDLSAVVPTPAPPDPDTSSGLGDWGRA